MAESTGSEEPRDRVGAKRSAGVAVLVAAGLAAGALAAGSLASGATADTGDPTTTGSTDSGATTTTETVGDAATTATETTDTTVTTTVETTTTDAAPPADTTPAPADTTTTTVEPAPPPAPDPATTDAVVNATPPPADPAPPPVTPTADPATSTTAAAPPATTPAPEGDMSSGGGREQPAEPAPHVGSGQSKTVAPPPSLPVPVQPALSARLLPTPAQIRFYVHATSTPPLPKLKTINHDLALRISTIAKEGNIHWALLAAVARVESRLGAANGPIAGRKLPVVPAGEADQLRALATFLHDQGASRNLSSKATHDALKAYFGSDKSARRVGALAAFYGALGLGRIQHGIGWHGKQLRKRVLRDTRLHIYPGGRADIRGRRVDPRVLITVEYLANATGSVRVSSLVSGHRLFTASGGVSAHVYGRAVDVTAVGGVRIVHHQGPGSVTERTVRLLLLLPQRMRPRQIVSLMDVDGPTGNHGSFALPNHSNRIQIGY
ncbi:MAG: hypothetical protein QOI71_65 [Gaiellales bacterium]|nr:hypothetical protein [Gaiellales bacterium]